MRIQNTLNYFPKKKKCLKQSLCISSKNVKINQNLNEIVPDTNRHRQLYILLEYGHLDQHTNRASGDLKYRFDCLTLQCVDPIVQQDDDGCIKISFICSAAEEQSTLGWLVGW